MIAWEQVKFFGPIQRFMCSAFDQSANTTDGGALNVRTMRSSSSAILFGALIAFSFLELIEVGGHLVEALLPETPIDREPVIDSPKALRFELARAPLRLAPSRNEAGFLQHLQMPRHRRKADFEWLGNLVHGRVTLHEP